MATNRPGISSGFHNLLDWFIPAELREVEETHRRVRTFVISHLFGPPAGLVAASYLLVIDPSFAAWTLILGVAAFVPIPFVLRATGAINALSLLSILYFIGIIFFAIYHYGGLTSPALPWTLTVPLVCVFFVEGRSRRICLAALLAGFGALCGLHLAGHRFPMTLGAGELIEARLISLLCAALYVSMMALSYVDLYEFSIAKLSAAKNQAEAANRAKSEFLATMSHELRTPLNAIIGFAQMIHQEILGPVQNERYRAYGGDIERSATHLLQIINDILDIAKIESGRFDIAEEVAEIETVTGEAIDIVRPLADQSKIIISVPFGRPNFLVYGDARLLRQMILNLLSNAVKFSPPSGQVQVAYTIDVNGDALVTVSDHGEGIPAEDLERILEPFEQVESAAIRRHGGIGLGLPLTKRMAELHGGQLAISSVLGQGTTVTIRLPKARVRSRPPVGGFSLPRVARARAARD